MELLVALLVLGILLALWPSGQETLIKRAHADLIKVQLIQTIQFARQQALMRGMSVSLCKSRDRKTCSGEWMQGMLVFLDPEKAGVVRDKTDVLAIVQPLSKVGVLHWRGFPAKHEYLIFLPEMRHWENGTFWYCEAPGQKAVWGVVLNKIGRVKTLQTNAQGEVMDTHGAILQCPA